MTWNSEDTIRAMPGRADERRVEGGGHPRRFGWQTLMEWTAIAAATALWLLLARRLIDGGGFSAVGLWLTAAGALLGYLAGDLMSGVVHWFCDTFFEEDTPLIGRVLILPFREHHRDPLAMTRHGFAEIAGNRFVYKKELQVGDQVASGLTGFGETAADYDFRIENARAGIGVRIRGDRPVSRMVLWSIRPTFAIEPFVTIAVQPGEQFTWTYTYDYYELPK